MKDFGERLKELRKKSNITQAELAEKLNVHSQTISRWERNISEPDMSMYETISKTLFVPLENLWGVPIPDKTVNGQFSLLQLGRAIYTERKRLKESQEELANVAGVSSDIVSKWERGLICPDIDTLLSLADHFKVSPSELYYAQLQHNATESIEMTVPHKPKKLSKRVILITVLSSILIFVLTAVVLIICLKPRDSSNSNTICTHVYKQEVTYATCTAQGYVTNICIKCGDSYVSDYTEKLHHTAGEWITDREATCSQEGSKHRECSVCHNIIETLTVEKLKHNYKTETVQSTCSVKGYTLYSCTTCGDNYKENYTDLLPHKSGEWIIDDEPTCSREGNKHKKCTVCGTQTETASIEKIPHNYRQEITPPSCTAQGYTTHICTECGSNYKSDYKAVLVHTSGEWIIDNEPTCSREGSKCKVCTVCGTQTETSNIEKLPHNYRQEITPPSCTAQGYTTNTCRMCGTQYKSDYTATLVHTPGDWITDIEPTCNREGSKHKECTVCGTQTETGNIEKIPHDYRQEITPPTCTAQGYTTHICTECGSNYKSDYKAVLVHISSDWIIDTESTCSREGSKHKVCTVCGTQTETGSIEKLPHNYRQEITPPSCTAQGYTTNTCKMCGTQYKSDYTATLAHTPGEWIIDRAATCEATGSRHKECTVCTTTIETAVIDKLAHSYVESIIPPEGDNQGYFLHTCSLCGDSYKDNYFLADNSGLEFNFDYSSKTCSVTGINDDSISEIEIPSTVNGCKVTAISGNAFYDCSALQEITIPDTVQEIGFQAFYKCVRLKEIVIPNSVVNIEFAAFRDCKSLKKVVLYSNLVRMGGYIFNGCISLEDVKILSTIKTISDSAFRGCNKLKEIILPEGLSTISSYAFYGCSELTKISIPSSVTFVGECAFDRCDSLTSVEFAQTEGWVADEIVIDGKLLADTKTAAEYLSLQYNLYIWVRN